MRLYKDKAFCLQKLFGFEVGKMNVRTEILAGITTFLTMSYILAVNPEVLGQAGMDKGAVFTATALSSVVATLVMALWAKLPFALAPGMGLNAFFAFTVCLAMGNSWQFARRYIVYRIDIDKFAGSYCKCHTDVIEERHWCRYRFVHSVYRIAECRYCNS